MRSDHDRVVLLWRKPPPLGGVIFSVPVGGCFARLETMGYGLVALLQSSGNLEGVTELLAVRSVSEPGGHAAWTGLATAALFAIRGSRRWLGWLRFASWDGLDTERAYVIVGAVSFGVLIGDDLAAPPRTLRTGVGRAGPPVGGARGAGRLMVTGRGR